MHVQPSQIHGPPIQLMKSKLIPKNLCDRAPWSMETFWSIKRFPASCKENEQRRGIIKWIICNVTISVSELGWGRDGEKREDGRRWWGTFWRTPWSCLNSGVASCEGCIRRPHTSLPPKEGCPNLKKREDSSECGPLLFRDFKDTSDVSSAVYHIPGCNACWGWVSLRKKWNGFRSPQQSGFKSSSKRRNH